MAIFLWEAQTKKGESKKGELDAMDEATARGMLRNQGYKSIEIKKKPKDIMEYLPFLQQRVKEKDVVVFSRIFSTMINAGLPLIQCLDLLAGQEENKTFSKIITSIKEDISGGSTLTEAFKKYPEVFEIKLVDYRVVLPPLEELGTDALVEVYVELSADGNNWTSRTRNVDQQLASQDALVEGYQYFLLKNAHE